MRPARPCLSRKRSRARYDMMSVIEVNARRLGSLAFDLGESMRRCFDDQRQNETAYGI